jgi:hypothetical protein
VDDRDFLSALFFERNKVLALAMVVEGRREDFV